MPTELQLNNRCQHTSANGRRCRMLRMNDHPSLCLQHQRQQQLQTETAPETVAAELLGSIEDFQTAAAVNQTLGRLFALTAADRIPPRNAAILAYICQLLLNTLPAVEREIIVSKGSNSWEYAIRHALQSLRKSPALAEAFLERATQAPGAVAGDKSRTAS